MDVATLTTLVAIIGCLVGLAGWSRNSKEDAENGEKRTSTIETKLDFISEDIKDTKAEIRAQRSEMSETKQLAITAMAKAESAHDRLDALEHND